MLAFSPCRYFSRADTPLLPRLLFTPPFSRGARLRAPLLLISLMLLRHESPVIPCHTNGFTATINDYDTTAVVDSHERGVRMILHATNIRIAGRYAMSSPRHYRRMFGALLRYYADAAAMPRDIIERQLRARCRWRLLAPRVVAR